MELPHDCRQDRGSLNHIAIAICFFDSPYTVTRTAGTTQMSEQGGLVSETVRATFGTFPFVLGTIETGRNVYHL